MPEKKSIFRNYGYVLLYQLLLIALPIITAPYVSRTLGIERIGEYSVAYSVVSYFTLFAILGSSLYGQRTIAFVKDDIQERTKAFRDVVSLRICTAAISLLLYFIYVYNVKSWLSIIAAIEIVNVCFDISWFYQGIEEYRIVTLSNGICKIIGTFAIWLLVKRPQDVSVYLFIVCFTNLAGNISSWFYIPKYIIKNKYKINVLFHLPLAFKLFASQFAIQIYVVLDKIMLAFLVGSNYENGCYEQAQKLIRILTTFVSSIGTVMISRISISIQTHNNTEMQNLILFSFSLMSAFTCPIVIGIIIISDIFVPIYYGGGYHDVILLTQILALIIPIIGCSNIIGMQYLIPNRKESKLTFSVSMGAIVNFSLNLMLIRAFGALGAVISSLISELTVTIIQFVIVKAELPLKKIFIIFSKYLMGAMIMGGFGLIIKNIFDTNILSLFIIILSSIFVYITFLVVTKDNLLILWKNRLKS